MAMTRLLPLVLCSMLPTLGVAQEVAPEADPQPQALGVHGGGVWEFLDGSDDSSRVMRFPADREKERRLPLRVRLETWEAPAIEVAKRLDDLQGAESLAALRAECLAGAGGVRLIHSPVTGADASTQMKAEAISERIYPTEYEPPSLPCGPITEKPEPPPQTLPESLERLMTTATPTSFETRNTGTSFSAVAQAVAVEEKTWDLAVLFEDVVFQGKDRFGHESLDLTMPAFASFQTGGLIRLKEGQWRLLSVMEPPRELDGKHSDKRWVTLVRIDAAN